MYHTLLALDQTLFFAMNHLPHPAVLNMLMLFLSFVGGNAIIWTVVTFVLFIREEKKDHWFFLPMTLAGVGAWLTSMYLFKPWFGRVRPVGLDGVILVDHSYAGASFPSAHAAIAWAFAVVLARIEPKWGWAFFVLATLICLSRIYLGVHYPSDIVGGALLGLAVGYLSLVWSTWVQQSFIQKKKRR